MTGSPQQSFSKGMDTRMTTEDVTKAAIDSAPPVIFGALHLFGVSLPDWVAIATLIYIVLQGAHLLWKWHRQATRNSRLGD
jgi:hypothetical protein